MVISKEDKILLESLYATKGYDTRKLLKTVSAKKNWTKGGLDSLRFDYVIKLFLIVTVNNFLMTNQSSFFEVTLSCFRGL